MKKITKRTLALILAVVMALPVMLVMPFSAGAEVSYTTTTTTCNDKSKGMIDSGTDRWNGGNFNIVSDNYNDKTAVGLWRYDISTLSSVASVQSANAIVTIASFEKETIAGMQVDFYLINGDSYVSGDSNTIANAYTDNNRHNLGWGAGTSGLENYKSKLGLDETTYAGTIVKQGLKANYPYSIDITQNIISARQKGWTNLVLVAIHRNSTNDSKGTGKEGIWSDTSFKEPSLSITTKAPSCNGTYEELSAAISSYEEKMNNAPYTNMTEAYDAYVFANKCADAILYGEATQGTSKIKEAINSLVVATDNMKSWTYRTGTATQAADYSYSKTSINSNYDTMTNVVYTFG
ncbi:MAG: hypothetical protein IJ731_02030, partial [Eubacterium sp.]|nr:hypothetical protein [Eubacterium sp.]